LYTLLATAVSSVLNGCSATLHGYARVLNVLRSFGSGGVGNGVMVGGAVIAI
jgi:hypothetical protein